MQKLRDLRENDVWIEDSRRGREGPVREKLADCTYHNRTHLGNCQVIVLDALTFEWLAGWEHCSWLWLRAAVRVRITGTHAKAYATVFGDRRRSIERRRGLQGTRKRQRGGGALRGRPVRA